MSSVRRKSSKRASAISATHTTHSDQASLAALHCATQGVFTLALLFLASQRHYTGLAFPHSFSRQFAPYYPHKGSISPKWTIFGIFITRTPTRRPSTAWHPLRGWVNEGG